MIARLFIVLALLFGWRTTAIAGESTEPTMREAGADTPRAPLVTPMPAELIGSTARAGRVTVIAEPGLEDQARELASGAEAALTEISADLIDDVPRPRHIEVRLVRESSELPRVAPAGRGAPKWAIGVAYPDLAIIGIALRRGGIRVDAMGTLRHELAHVALGAALGDRAPHWLHEGFAYQHSEEWSMDRTETLAGMAWLGGIVSLDELDRTFPAEESPANRAYAQSYDFVGYLARRGRWEDTNDDGDRWPFRRFLADISKGKSLDAAANKQFGKNMHLLFEEWRSNLSSRYLLAPIGLLGLAAWIGVALLLALAWKKRRKQNRARIARWDAEERQRELDERIRKALAEEELRRGLGLPDPLDPGLLN